MAASASKLAEQNVRVIVMRALYSGGSRNFTQNLRSTISAFRPLMLFVAGKRILQTLCEKKSNRKLIGIGYLFDGPKSPQIDED